MSQELRDISEKVAALMGQIATINTVMAEQAEMMVASNNDHFSARDCLPPGTEGFALIERQHASIPPAVAALRRHTEALELLHRLYGRLLDKN